VEGGKVVPYPKKIPITNLVEKLGVLLFVHFLGDIYMHTFKSAPSPPLLFNPSTMAIAMEVVL